MRLTLTLITVTFLLLSQNVGGTDRPPVGTNASRNTPVLDTFESEQSKELNLARISLSAQRKTVQNSLEYDKEGRLVGFVIGGRSVALRYESGRLDSVGIGEKILRMTYAVSEKTGQVDALIVRGQNGEVIDVLRPSAVFGFGPAASAAVVDTLGFEQKSSELMREAFRAEQAAAASSHERSFELKDSRKKCADTTDCDGMRDLQYAWCDNQYEKDMAAVDYLRSTIPWPVNIVSNMFASAGAIAASDKKLDCRGKAVLEWVRCVMGC